MTALSILFGKKKRIQLRKETRKFSHPAWSSRETTELRHFPIGMCALDFAPAPTSQIHAPQELAARRPIGIKKPGPLNNDLMPGKQFQPARPRTSVIHALSQ